jgi:hypothetical protein
MAFFGETLSTRRGLNFTSGFPVSRSIKAPIGYDEEMLAKRLVK